MTMKYIWVISSVATLVLGACQKKEPVVIDTTAPDPMASQLANAARVELPPAMVASLSFRCKDNSLVYVDFFKGDAQANLRLEKNSPPIVLKVAPNKPLSGDGYTLTRNQNQISLVNPDGTTLSCHR